MVNKNLHILAAICGSTAAFVALLATYGGCATLFLLDVGVQNVTAHYTICEIFDLS